MTTIFMVTSLVDERSPSYGFPIFAACRNELHLSRSNETRPCTLTGYVTASLLQPGEPQPFQHPFHLAVERGRADHWPEISEGRFGPQLEVMVQRVMCVLLAAGQSVG